MKIEEHVMFTAKHKNWKVGDKLLVMRDENIAHFLASISNTVNMKISEYLIDVIDVAAVMSLAEDLAEGELWEVVKVLKSPKTSRKIGKMVFESDKKLKKQLVDVAKALLVRETLSRMLSVYYPEDPIMELKIMLPYKEDHINFTAKHGSWIVVKRLIIDEKTELADVARLLASINETITSKLPIYAEIDLKGIDEWFAGVKKAKSDVEIKTLVDKYLHFPAHRYAPSEFEKHARIYALRKMLEKVGLSLDVPAKPLEKYLEKKG
ncbi:DUF2666 family protein [Thermococcus barophilus]|uniref:DUF2666 domain-containing protein n=2 Tax=Thermococcus barophilus TaxID=55802 RepID=A0A0S1XB55_THEBA|nr:DUF2666 family protein [Thermococcus barophilus]ADT83885.1 hypothetical protein TERMP_00909 [Thermococcus barophilus MP]ALM75030.1 hypothetical protein TBCH5v1_1088 [Thermococcus barophilus]